MKSMYFTDWRFEKVALHLVLANQDGGVWILLAPHPHLVNACQASPVRTLWNIERIKIANCPPVTLTRSRQSEVATWLAAIIAL